MTDDRPFNEYYLLRRARGRLNARVIDGTRMVRALPDARRPDWVVALITLLCLPLFVYGLGNTYLWQDEAQTALLARSVLQNGVPMVGEGAESLSAHMGPRRRRQRHLPSDFLAAGVRSSGQLSAVWRVELGGAGAVCARGLALRCRSSHGWSRMPAARAWPARAAVLLTATSVPFIVCSRQSRYYALATAAALLTAGCLREACRGGRLTAANGLRPAPPLPRRPDAAGPQLRCDGDRPSGCIAVHWAIVAGPARTGDRDSGPRGLSLWLVLLVWIAVSFTAPMRNDTAGLAADPTGFRYGTFYYAGQIDSHVVPLPLVALGGSGASAHRDAGDASHSPCCVLLALWRLAPSAARCCLRIDSFATSFRCCPSSLRSLQWR